MAEYNPADTDDLDARRAETTDRQRIARQRSNEDLKWLMGSARGRRIVWWLLEHSGVYRLSFDTNAMRMAFAEGHRNFGLQVLAQVQATCPELYLQMIEEAGPNDRSNADDGSAHAKRR